MSQKINMTFHTGLNRNLQIKPLFTTKTANFNIKSNSNSNYKSNSNSNSKSNSNSNSNSNSKSNSKKASNTNLEYLKHLVYHGRLPVVAVGTNFNFIITLNNNIISIYNAKWYVFSWRFQRASYWSGT